jgi:hypothetical protein
MPDYQTFFNATNLETLWSNVKWILFFVAPGVMIWTAIHAVELLISVVRETTTSETDRKDEEDFDIYHY